MKKSRGVNFKDANLATKMTIIIGSFAVIIFLIMNFFSLAGSGKYLKQSIDREFKGLCQQNRLKIENIINECEIIANNTNSGLDIMYNKGEDTVESDNEQTAPIQYISKIYGEPISKSRYNAENIILNNIWSAVKDNEDILGAGVFMEPNAFSSSMDEYAPYVVAEDVANETAEKLLWTDYKDKNYYVKAKETKSMYFTDAYTGGNGTTTFSVSFPIIHNDQFKGILLLDIRSDIFEVMNIKNDDYKSIYFNLLNSNNSIIYSTHTDIIGKNFSETVDSETFSAITEKLTNNTDFSIETGSGNDKRMRYFSPVNVGEEVWWVQSVVLSNEYNAVMSFMTKIMLVIAAISLLTLLFAMAFLMKKMLKPVNSVVEAAKKIERGDLNIELEIKHQDEIGILAMAFNKMSQNLKIIIKDISYVLGEMSDGNFQVKSENAEHYVGDYGEILSGVRGIISNLSSTLTDISTASDQVNGGAEQVSSAAQALSQGTTEQASYVEELSATMTEIADKIKYNAQKAETANTLSQEAGNEVVISNKKMKEMSSAMEDITVKSNEISKIIKTIDDIAFQTNILALNAAVEAARAGAAGKGFAVVADEVRNLAQKSAEAAKNITALIEGTVGAVANGAKLTAETAKSLITVAEKAGKVAELITEISNASQEQAGGVAQISLGIEQISAVIQTNSATAEESAAASEELSGQSNMLDELVGQFKLKGTDKLSPGNFEEFDVQTHQNDFSEISFANNSKY